MKFEIRHRYSGEVLFALETESLKWCLEAAVKSSSNLSYSDLRGSDLRGSNIEAAKNADLIIAQTSILVEGDIIGYKKLSDGVIAKLLIPKEAKRSNATGRKCRAEYADVLEVIGADEGFSSHDGSFMYKAGVRVTPDKWDENRWNECSSGIHFFITKIEAENY